MVGDVEAYIDEVATFAEGVHFVHLNAVGFRRAQAYFQRIAVEGVAVLLGFKTAVLQQVVAFLVDQQRLHQVFVLVVVGKQGKEFFEEQGTIAEELGLDKKTVWRCMKKFKEHAVVTGDSRRTAKGNSLWFYREIKNDLSFWIGSEGEPKPLTAPKAKQNNSKHAADRAAFPEYDDDLPERAM